MSSAGKFCETKQEMDMTMQLLPLKKLEMMQLWPVIRDNLWKKWRWCSCDQWSGRTSEKKNGDGAAVTSGQGGPLKEAAIQAETKWDKWLRHVAVWSGVLQSRNVRFMVLRLQLVCLTSESWKPVWHNRRKEGPCLSLLPVLVGAVG